MDKKERGSEISFHPDNDIESSPKVTSKAKPRNSPLSPMEEDILALKREMQTEYDKPVLIPSESKPMPTSPSKKTKPADKKNGSQVPKGGDLEYFNSLSPD